MILQKTGKSLRGFTLIEVLVAMTVFAVAAMAVLKATGQHTDSLGYLERKTVASMVADNQMALFVLDGKVPSSAKNGKSEMAGRTWYWRIKPVSTTDNRLRAIDVSVATDTSQQYPLVSIRTYVPVL